MQRNQNSENLSLYVCRGDVCKRIPLELNVKEDKQCEVRLEPVMTAPNGTTGIRANIRILTVNNINYFVLSNLDNNDEIISRVPMIPSMNVLSSKNFVYPYAGLYRDIYVSDIIDIKCRDYIKRYLKK